ncbi:hypothetical protein [uncultured Gemmiger sp.]|uniref:hypothetical protein n=1 Tax=uncultured Gemmiger sp. TaxID=1623490 RepID=UPI0025D452DC|nr:hypothetical protein [uncultured Gemmiger sp.]
MAKRECSAEITIARHWNGQLRYDIEGNPEEVLDSLARVAASAIVASYTGDDRTTATAAFSLATLSHLSDLAQKEEDEDG